MPTPGADRPIHLVPRSEEHTSELQSLAVISYAVFCLKKKKQVRRNDDLLQLGARRVARRCGRRDRPHDVRDRRADHLSFFFTDPATPEIYTTANPLSLHAALPI